MRNTFYIRLLSLTSLLGIIGVSFGAFGAHFLKSKLNAADLETIKTGVLYLFIHTLVILFVVIVGKTDFQSRILKLTGILLVIGIVLFSGSLFLIATKSLTGISVTHIGFLTPVGGLCFIAGWTLLLMYSILPKM